MRPKINMDVVESLKNSRRKSEPDTEPKKSRDLMKKKNKDPYTTFLFKYHNLEESIDGFGTRDLLYYFREVAGEEGYRYSITNIKKDLGIFKNILKNYNNREICAMIDFLYRSEQDYLRKDTLSPNLLSSNWVNTIYADMKLWVDDKYKPREKKNHKDKHVREWTGETKDIATSSIGEWEE